MSGLYHFRVRYGAQVLRESGPLVNVGGPRVMAKMEDKNGG
jgi:hypothetical protein